MEEYNNYWEYPGWDQERYGRQQGIETASRGCLLLIQW